ncbi:hypothetical protein X880_6053 [Burkholderia pseudomallei MSHR4032]|uniref:hypothetical protein n=1 Tax=Burkholderia pseudomallei TaxID=28450 RepID=UPI000538DB53|nr:hypothetical protein [Burkholderia pseudomallei]KGU89839.1 hypothetical protein X880_6053 [Burkholderia pseudomallei MSHR4032]
MIDVKKLRELSKETRHMAYVASEIGHAGAAEQFIECADAILALCDRLEAMEREREDQNRYLAAQSEEIAGLKQRLAQQTSGEVMDFGEQALSILEELVRMRYEKCRIVCQDHISAVTFQTARALIDAARTQGGES